MDVKNDAASSVEKLEDLVSGFLTDDLFEDGEATSIQYRKSKRETEANEGHSARSCSKETRRSRERDGAIIYRSDLVQHRVHLDALLSDLTCGGAGSITAVRYHGEV